MKLHRFFVNDELESGRTLLINDADKIHQWLSVFRMKAGDTVILFNGDGWDYVASFTEIHKKGATLEIGSRGPSIMPKKKIHLYMALIRKDLFELVVEKATELGVSEITPIVTERTLCKNLNMERLRKIAIEASEQCGRGTIPHITSIVNLESAINNAGGELFVCDMNSESIRNLKLEIDNCSLLVGPEGGWGEQDKKIFSNCKKVSLSDLVLRAETAAIVGVASLQ